MKSISERVDVLRDEARQIAHEIHEHPELGNEEFHSVELLTEFIMKHEWGTPADII